MSDLVVVAVQREGRSVVDESTVEEAESGIRFNEWISWRIEVSLHGHSGRVVAGGCTGRSGVGGGLDVLQ